MVLAIIVASPLWVRVGAKSVIEEWKQQNNVNYGIDYDLTLQVIKTEAYIDVFKQYSTYTLYLSGGGYGFIKKYDFSEGYPNVNEYISNCHVLWLKDKIEFIEPSGIKTIIPKETFLTLMQ